MNNVEMLKQLFEAIDSKDADKFVTYLTDDSSFIFGNAEEVKGVEPIREYVAGFFSAIKSLNHKLHMIIEKDEHVFCRGNVIYTRLDGSNLSVPFTNYFLINNGKIDKYQIYVDASRLFNA